MSKPPANVVGFKPRPNDLEQRIHEISADSFSVEWGQHARQRMAERDISDVVMFDTLRTGMIRGKIIAGNTPGEWVAKIVKKQRGRREVGVVTVVIHGERLFVKTVEWED